MPNPQDYVYIRAWGEHLGSFHHYIEVQQELAAKERAPLRSIYRSHEGRHGWHVVDDVKSVVLRDQLEKRVKGYGENRG